jgi:D-glycero-alpha-D-manno-heptose-7-phosphate kinase
LPCPGEFPATVNIALDLRTYVRLLPYEEGSIKISSSGFRGSESASADSIPFDSRFGLFFAAASYFGFHGLEIRIESGSPVQAAMGGSSTALAALLLALSRLEKRFGGEDRPRAEILRLAFFLEDSLSGGFCGMQDHAAAVYGGVNRWYWSYGEGRLFYRDRLMDKKSAGLFDQRMVVAHSGKRHVSSRTNRRWVRDFLSGRTRTGWIEVNRIVNGFAACIRQKNWKEAVDFLRKETALRRMLTPEALTPLTESMVTGAEAEGGAARFAGAGAGGAVWALAPDVKTAAELRKSWEKLLAGISGAAVLECRTDHSGVKLEP